MVTRSSAVRGEPLPGVIKRNTILLAATQAFVGMGTQMVPSLGAVIVMQLTGAATLAGLATSIASLSRFLVSYPIGWVADALGRQVALLIGQLLCLIGTFCLGTAVFALSLFVLGILLFGLGVGAGQQLRLAAADLCPPARRTEGLGLVLDGSLVGALGGPLVELYGLPAVTLISTGLMLIPFVMLLRMTDGMMGGFPAPVAGR